jgi:hypothetical protein
VPFLRGRKEISVGVARRFTPVIVFFVMITSSSIRVTAQDEGPPSSSSNVASVSRLSPVYELEQSCGQKFEFWSGTPESVVQYTLESDKLCKASLTEQRLKNAMNPPHDPKITSEKMISEAPLGQQVSGQATVLDRSRLICVATGNSGKCKCKITGIEPSSLPEDVVLGKAAPLVPGPPINDPVQGTPIPAGTRLVLSCGKKPYTLWSGKKSYVTVLFKGCFDEAVCPAEVRSYRNDELDSFDSSDQTGPSEFSHTFGPITRLEVVCGRRGPGEPFKGECNFQVTEIITLP